jgi:hypothetical protein
VINSRNTSEGVAKLNLGGNQRQNLNAEDAEDFAEERKGGLYSANLCKDLRVLSVSKTTFINQIARTIRRLATSNFSLLILAFKRAPILGIQKGTHP